MFPGKGNHDMDLKGKRALVTGASQGLGRVIALELARKGCEVIVNCAHHPENARKWRMQSPHPAEKQKPAFAVFPTKLRSEPCLKSWAGRYSDQQCAA